ncbi:MAG TPA: class I SAM-dependent methyltransferase [Pseudolabrys sp.]|jgi:ubiquinone/menaquinone biosynthesis C-methylase UbiE
MNTLARPTKEMPVSGESSGREPDQWRVPDQPREHGRNSDARSYALGHSEGELKRLEYQNNYYRDLTEAFLLRAGLSRGLRVLDIGCGAGDTSFMAARLVGTSGSVFGIDRSPDAVATATQRAAEAGLTGVQFAVSELDALPGRAEFDAVIGRFVLMYMPDPAASLRQIRRCLRPGGVVAFQENVMRATGSVPELPLFTQCCHWIIEMFERSGAESAMGAKLYAKFLAAGLSAPQLIMGAPVEGGPQAMIYDYVEQVLRSLLPHMERLGIATAAEVDVDTIAERLRNQAVEQTACLFGPPLVGAWTRLPA